jgi:hypothetical protein
VREETAFSDEFVRRHFDFLDGEASDLKRILRTMLVGRCGVKEADLGDYCRFREREREEMEIPPVDKSPEHQRDEPEKDVDSPQKHDESEQREETTEAGDSIEANVKSESQKSEEPVAEGVAIDAVADPIK